MQRYYPNAEADAKNSPFAAWSMPKAPAPADKKKDASQTFYGRRMMTDSVWKNRLTEGERESCGGYAGLCRVKGWVNVLECDLDENDVVGLFSALAADLEKK